MEEFPNTSMSTSTALKAFRTSILNYLASSAKFSMQDEIFNRTPVVMIITETHQSSATASHDVFSAHRLLGPDILHHSGVSIIEFNPIAHTFLTKALDLVIKKKPGNPGDEGSPALEF